MRISLTLKTTALKGSRDETQSDPQELDHFQAEKKMSCEGIEMVLRSYYNRGQQLARCGSGNEENGCLRSDLGAFTEEINVKVQGEKQRYRECKLGLIPTTLKWAECHWGQLLDALSYGNISIALTICHMGFSVPRCPELVSASGPQLRMLVPGLTGPE